MRKLIVLIGLALVSAPLWAQLGVGSSSLNWSNPTLYVDGSPLPGLAFIHVERSTVDSVGPYQRIASLGPAFLALQSYLDENLYNGTYFYRVIATDSQFLIESDPSNVASKTITLGGTNDPPKPEAPTGLTVQ